MMRVAGLLLAFLLLVLAPTSAHARCKYSSGGNTSVTFSLPTTIVIPSDLPNGAVIASSLQADPADPPVISCSGNFGENVTYGVVNSRGSFLADTLTFETGVPGVGYRITHPTDYLTAYPLNSEWVTTSTFSVTSGLELIKIGTITSGSTLPMGKLGDWRWGSLYPETFQLGNAVTFTTPSCDLVTDPINVILPAVTTSAFSGVGSTSGTTSFQIALSCPAGTTVNKITMHTALPDGRPGVIQPAGAGYAAGIGVRVLDGNSNPVAFETQMPVTPNATTTIPYYAQYFQTADTISGGAVKATVTFDIFYQ